MLPFVALGRAVPVQRFRPSGPLAVAVPYFAEGRALSGTGSEDRARYGSRGATPAAPAPETPPSVAAATARPAAALTPLMTSGPASMPVSWHSRKAPRN